MDKNKEKLHRMNSSMRSSRERAKCGDASKDAKGATSFWAGRDAEAKRRGLHKLNLKKLEMINEYVIYSANKGPEPRSYMDDLSGGATIGVGIDSGTNNKLKNLLIETKDLYKKTVPYTPVGVLTPFKSTAKNTDKLS